MDDLLAAKDKRDQREKILELRQPTSKEAVSLFQRLLRKTLKAIRSQGGCTWK